MIKKLFGIFEKQMVEEKFLQWIFRTINNVDYTRNKPKHQC